MENTKIAIIEDGPALISSDKPIRVNGELKGEKVAICRCGLSANKVFCDGSHKQIKEIEKQGIE